MKEEHHIINIKNLAFEKSIQIGYVIAEKQVNLIPQGYVIRLIQIKLHIQKMVIFNRKKKPLFVYVFQYIFDRAMLTYEFQSCLSPNSCGTHHLSIILYTLHIFRNHKKPSLNQASYK